MLKRTKNTEPKPPWPQPHRPRAIPSPNTSGSLWGRRSHYVVCQVLRMLQRSKSLTSLLFHIRMKTVSMRIHGHNCNEILHTQMPHRFRYTELHQVDTIDLLHRPSIVLRRAPDAVQIDRAALLQSRE